VLAQGFISIWDFADFEPANAYANLSWAFETALTKLGVAPSLGVEEVANESPICQEKLLLYLAKWHRALAGAGTLNVRYVAKAGDVNEDDEDDEDSRGSRQAARGWGELICGLTAQRACLQQRKQ
jgi:hypothetical protein